MKKVLIIPTLILASSLFATEAKEAQVGPVTQEVGYIALSNYYDDVNSTKDMLIKRSELHTTVKSALEKNGFNEDALVSNSMQFYKENRFVDANTSTQKLTAHITFSIEFPHDDSNSKNLDNLVLDLYEINPQSLNLDIYTKRLR